MIALIFTFVIVANFCFVPVSQWMDTLQGFLLNPVDADQCVTLTDPYDASVYALDRARVYLHSNCAHYHRKHAGSAVLSKMHHDLPLEKTDMVGVGPTQGTFRVHGAHVISVGDPLRSILFVACAS